MKLRQVSLSVNDVPIPLDGFAQSFTDHVVQGILAGLKGAGEIHKVSLSINGDAVAINLDNAPVPINPFVNKITRNTIIGMVSSLRGVSQIDRLEISITE